MLEAENWTEIKAPWLEAEDDLRIALLQTQRVINDYYSMAPSDGDFALDKALTPASGDGRIRRRVQSIQGNL